MDKTDPIGHASYDLKPKVALGVSVIVTNHNYGHFLPACLESLRSQTRPPDEIIVVDDGSADGSAEYLASVQDVQVITKSNGGQASAFNAGFAASTGDIILFLDADDTLAPDAIFVITSLWSEKLSGLSFDLEMINSKGERTGHYPMRGLSSDALPDLLRDLTFPFMPTSGNAFRRSAISWAFPLPAERWRISADALLIRTAILAGPMKHVPHRLGFYRAHGGNNYFRDGTPPNWHIRRGLMDIADAGLDLIKLSDKSGSGLSRAERSLILSAAVRNRMKCDQFGEPRKDLAGYLTRASQCWPMSKGLRLYCLFLLLRLTAPFSESMRRWIASPLERPRLVDRMLRAFLGARLRKERSCAILSRFGPPSVGVQFRTTGSDVWNCLSGTDWCRGADALPALTPGRTGRLWFRRSDVAPAELVISLRPEPADLKAEIEVRHAGTIVGSFDIVGECEISVLLPAPGLTEPVPDDVEIILNAVEEDTHPAWLRPFAPAPHMTIESITLSPSPPRKTGIVLPMTSDTAFAPLAETAGSEISKVLPGGVRTKVPGSEAILIAPPPIQETCCLSLVLGVDQIPGWMTLKVGSMHLFAGNIGPSSGLTIQVPGEALPEDGPLEIVSVFLPSDVLVEPAVSIERMGWQPGSGSAAAEYPLLDTNRWVSSQSHNGLWPYLWDGWELSTDECPVTFQAAAFLRLSHGPLRAGSSLVLSLEIGLMTPLPQEEVVVLVVTVNGEQAHAVGLAGDAVVEVPLNGLLHKDSCRVDVGLHATRRGTANTDAEFARHFGLELKGLGLHEPALEPCALQAPPYLTTPSVPIHQLIGNLAVALDGSASTDELLRLRQEIRTCVEELQPSAAAALLTPEVLALFCRLGTRLHSSDGPVEPPPKKSSPTYAFEWIRWFAVASLSGPAYRSMRDFRLLDMPILYKDASEVIASYLMADAASDTPTDACREFHNHLCERLAELSDIVRSCPIWHPHRALAGQMLSNCRPHRLLFISDNVASFARVFATALETRLVADGHSLEQQFGGRTEGRVRIGILMRHGKRAPEPRIIRGILDCLPRSDFDITIFMTEEALPSPDSFPADVECVGLAGQPVGLSVATIRRRDLDVMIYGSFFFGHEPLTEIAAHRLARRQIAISAISPVTSGLTCCDAFVLGDLGMPKDVLDDYTEPTVTAPGTGQIFLQDAGQERSEDSATLDRARLCIPADATVLVSGAMLDKIGRDLLSVWMGILKANPDTVLVLYPFAANWKRAYDKEAFLSRLAKAAHDEGVDGNRIHVLSSISAEDVGRLLRASDLYLDSFPYSGATTTVEALSAGLPAIALRGTSQRGHQAAGWLSAFGLDQLVAKDEKQYVELVSELSDDPGRRRGLGKIALANAKSAMAQRDFADWLPIYLRGDISKRETPRYLFHHLPKAGGTSVRKMFAGWFDPISDYREPWSDVRPAALHLDEITPNQLLCGHFAADGIPLNSRYPETADSSKWRRFTFIRDPFELALSTYFFEAKNRHNHDPSFKSPPLGNYLRGYGGAYLRHFECTPDNWRQALDGYWFIGTLERLDDCMSYLAEQIGKPKPDTIRHDHRTERDLQADPEDIAIFARNMALEFEIYRHVSARLRRLLGEENLDEFPR